MMKCAVQSQDVLLIHRDKVLSQLACAALRGRQHVDAAQTPAQVMQALKQRPYAAIVVTLCTIERSAWDLLKIVVARRDCPPVVVVTPDTTLETRRKVLDLGVDELLYMPFKLDALRKAVSRAVGLSQTMA